MPLCPAIPCPTGARQTGTVAALLDPYGAAEWLESGGPLDACERIPAGSVTSAEWLTAPGLFSGIASRMRPGAFE